MVIQAHNLILGEVEAGGYQVCILPGQLNEMLSDDLKRAVNVHQ